MASISGRHPKMLRRIRSKPGNHYIVSFSYWSYYIEDYTRLESSFWEFLKYTYQKYHTQVAIHRYNRNDGGGQIGTCIWSKDFNNDEY